MENKYRDDSKKIIEFIGKENIISYTHCQTRLRIVVKNSEEINFEEINKLESVSNSINAQGQYQVIIGLKVGEFFKEFDAEYKGEESLEKNESTNSKVVALSNENWFQRLMGIFSEVFTGIIPIIVSGGIIVALINILDTNWYASSGGQYVLTEEVEILSSIRTLLYIPACAIFYYIPVHIVWSTFNRKNKVPVLGIAIGLMLVSPTILVSYNQIFETIGSYSIETSFILNGDTIVESGFYTIDEIIQILNLPEGSTMEVINNELTSLINDQWIYVDNVFDSLEVNNAYIFGHWFMAISYVGQVIPALLVGLFAVWFYEQNERYTPGSIRYFWPSLITLLVVVIVAHGILAPIGLLISEIINIVFSWGFTNEIAKWIFGPLFAFMYPFIILMGVQHILNVLMLNLTAYTGLAITGSNYIFPILAISNITQGAAVVGLIISLKIDKDSKEDKGTMIAASSTSIMGITEPSIFGYNVRYVFPFIAAALASSIAGILIVGFDITAYGIGIGGVSGFININHSMLLGGNILVAWGLYLAIMFVAALLSIVFTILFSRRSSMFDFLTSTKVFKGN